MVSTSTKRIRINFRPKISDAVRWIPGLLFRPLPKLISVVVILGSKFVLLGRSFYMSYIWCMKTCIVDGMHLTRTLHGWFGTLVDLLHSTHFQNERTARCSDNSWFCCGNLGGMHAHFLLGMSSNPPLLAGVTLCSPVCCKLFLSDDIKSLLTFHRKRYADQHCKSPSSW